MNTTYRATFTTATTGQRQAMIQLLKAENLPVDDLPVSLDNFLVATEEEKVIGAIGLELYGEFGLLRSMVVDKEHRNKNIASELVQRLENDAKAKGITCIYLLTETAPQYFERKGYQKIARDDVPENLKASSEFSHVCPVSAVVMKKQLH